MSALHIAHMPKIIAHRGASAQAPENTLAAFARAAELGARAVEFDATVSRDGIAMVLHDSCVDRCSDGYGPVVLKTAEDLAALDAGGWFAAEFKGEHLPMLEAALDLVASAAMTLNLEIKPTLGWEEPTVRAVAAALQRAWPKTAPVLVSSMNPLALDIFHDLMDGVPLALITEAVPENWQQRLDRHHCQALHCAHEFVTPGLAEQLHGAGHRLHVYTVNDIQVAKALFAMGVDAVFTDVPEVMLSEFAD